MAATKTQLVGGAFQDGEGNPLALGYLKMKLSQDASVSGVGNVCAGIEITIFLDINGNAVTSPAQSVWANTGGVLAPINTYYKVTGYTAAGQKAWGLNNQQVAAGATFNLDSWVPNSVISWFPEVSQNTAIALEVNGTLNEDQALLNLTAGSNVTITDEGNGEVSISASGGSPFSGGNLIPIPSFNDEDGGLAGYTMVLKIPGNMLQAYGDSVVVGVMTGSTLGGTGFIVSAASIAATLNSHYLAGTYPVTDPSIPWTTAPISLTFPGGFSSPNTLYESDPVSITIDPDHTYFVLIYLDSTNTGNVPFANWSSAGAIPQFWVGMFGYVSGNHTADADSTAVTNPGGSGNLHAIARVAIA